MELLDDIIDLAASDTGSVATLLRKCLVLAHTLRNDRLLTWAENELNGYKCAESVPEYRKTSAPANSPARKRWDAVRSLAAPVGA